MQRNTPNNETITVEYGFIDSPKDDIEQIEKNYKNYVEAVIRALADYKGFKYTPPLGSDYYIVKKGDSLWSIANKYGITVKELKEINKLIINIVSEPAILFVVFSILYFLLFIFFPIIAAKPSPYPIINIPVAPILGSPATYAIIETTNIETA